MKNFLVTVVAVIFAVGVQAQATDNNPITSAALPYSAEDLFKGNALSCKAKVFQVNIESYLMRVLSESQKASLPQVIETIKQQYTNQEETLKQEFAEDNPGKIQELKALRAKLTAEIATATGDDKQDNELALKQVTALIQAIEAQRPLVEEQLNTGFFGRESFNAQMKARAAVSESEQLYITFNKQRQDYITECNNTLLTKDGEAVQSIAFVETITADMLKESIPHSLDKISLLVQLIDDLENALLFDKKNQTNLLVNIFLENQKVEAAKHNNSLRIHARTWNNAIFHILRDVLYDNTNLVEPEKIFDKITMTTPAGAIAFPEEPSIVPNIINSITQVQLPPKVNVDINKR